MKIIFFGTPEYVLPICDALHKKFNHGREKQFVAVVTQPPKPSGRNKNITRSEVDHWAFKHKLQIIFELNEIPQADLGICASYGKIIPEKVLKRFTHGILNVHPSLLPKYRGASPVQAAIANGEDTTGVTVFKMDSQMDHGPIISSFKEKIADDDTTQTLRDRLFERSAEFLIELLPNYLNGKIKPKEQNHEKATFTKTITKQDGFTKPDQLNKALEGKKAESIHNHIRAMYPWPGAWTKVDIGKQNIKILKILKAHLENLPAQAGKKLVLDKVQLEGKNPVSWKQFKQGYPNASF
jgi:methionyl-tRNA formyltransferase